MNRALTRGALVLAALSLLTCDRDAERAAAIARAVDSTPVMEATRRFYEERGFRPAWREPAATVRAILAAGEDGLDPSAYRLDEIERALGEENNDAQLDVLLTDGMILLARHLHAGRVDESGKPVWHAEREDARRVRAALDDPDSLPRPKDPGYAALKESLARHRALEDAPTKKLDAIVASLERRRQAPPPAPRRVEVNVPAFTATYFENGKPRLVSRVIVGTRTSLFRS